jgi:hypothetical protein
MDRISPVYPEKAEKDEFLSRFAGIFSTLAWPYLLSNVCA